VVTDNTINTAALQRGAEFALYRQYDQEWQPITTAPKDGTIIEVRCTYGVAPWYGLFHWTKQITLLTQTGKLVTSDSPGWHKVGEEASGFSEGPSFSWRPYKGTATAYVDPTGGMQNSAAYWRGAVAAKSGLPLNAFESQAKRNEDADSWWGRFLNWLMLSGEHQ
jgi:hypothetical protein